MKCNNKYITCLLLFCIVAILAACTEKQNNTQSISGPLPILGDKEEVDGVMQYHEVPDYAFINQYGDTVTANTFTDKVYVVDYFFTSCPTICPKVKEQEIRIFDHFKGNEKVGLLSVSIDPKYDDVERLHWYAERLEIPKSNWHLVTGDKDFIYDSGDEFFHIAVEDEEAPGGFNHDGRLVLVDKNKHIRSFCNGLEEEDVKRFIADIENLLSEK